MRQTQEIDQTLETLNILLEDEETFHHVCSALFKAIDVNGDESLQREEIRDFLDKICEEMGVTQNPDDATLDRVFEELDENGDNDISVEELEAFLRRIFILQRDEINRIIKRK